MKHAQYIFECYFVLFIICIGFAHSRGIHLSSGYVPAREQFVDSLRMEYLRPPLCENDHTRIKTINAAARVRNTRSEHIRYALLGD